MLLLQVLLGLVILLWGGVALKARRVKQTNRFRVGVEDLPPESAVRVTVVVPARNEVHNIGACVESIIRQDLPGLRAVVLDDGSTDGTGAVLQGLLAGSDQRLRLLSGGDAPLPAGWKGKPWACQRASEAAVADADPPEWLLFTDADVRLHPHAVGAAVGYATRNHLQMMSGIGRLEMVSFWEKVLQPIVAGAIVAGTDIEKVNDPARRKGNPLANGQFILIRREAYLAVGGHGAVRDNVLDDVGMATAVCKAGMAYQIVYMRNLFSCRMYHSFDELWKGWTKNLFAGIEYRWDRVVGVSIFTFLTSVLPYIVALVGLVVGLDAVTLGLAWGAVLAIQVMRYVLDGIFEHDRRYGLSHFLGNVLFIALFFNSGIRTVQGTAVWKGRALQMPGEPKA